jgi:hypothetical protein
VVVPKVNKICGRIRTRGTLEFQFIDELANELVKLSRRGECEGTSCARVSGGGCEARTVARGPRWESVVAGRPGSVPEPDFRPNSSVMAVERIREDQRGFI